MNWLRSSLCASNACAEVAHVGDQTYIRETRSGNIVHLTADEWDAFEQGVAAGEFRRPPMGGMMEDG